MAEFLAQLWPIAAVVLTAFVAGFINAVAGGGTFLSFPALVGIAGLTEKAANMTSTIGLWPGSASSIVAAKPEYKKLPTKMVVLYSLISLIGGAIGAALLIYTSNQTFRFVIPWLLLFATVVFAFSKPIARWAGRKHGDRSLKWTLFVAAVQLVVAIYGGYFGAGIGVLMLAGLAFAGLDDIHQMNALKVLLATWINGISVVLFIAFSATTTIPDERVNWLLAILMAIASVIGGFVGMGFARKLDPAKLRYAILVIGVLLTLTYFYKTYFA